MPSDLKTNKEPHPLKGKTFPVFDDFFTPVPFIGPLEQPAIRYRPTTLSFPGHLLTCSKLTDQLSRLWTSVFFPCERLFPINDVEKNHKPLMKRTTLPRLAGIANNLLTGKGHVRAVFEFENRKKITINKIISWKKQ